MPALIEPSRQAPHQGLLPQSAGPARLLTQVIQTPLHGITDGLAQVLGNGQALPPPQQMPVHATQPVPQPVQLEARDTASMTVEQLLNRIQPEAVQPAGSQEGLETLRMQMFGRYYQEIEARLTQVTQATEGGVARARRAMLERVDELGAALHRDMVAMRQEVLKEIEDLKRDVFTTVMSLSAINDKLSLAESRNRETWVAVTKALTDRIEQQAKAQADVIENFRHGVNEGMEQRVVAVVESTLVRLANARRSGSSQPESKPAFV